MAQGAFSPENPDWQRRLEPAVRREIQSLERESDPELRAEGFFQMALRLENSGNLEVAVEIYREFLQAGETIPTASATLRSRAQQRLDAILGRGAVGPRAEFLLRRLAQEATDPTMILSMAMGSAVFRMTRLAVLGRLTSAPTAGFLTRGLGAQALAGLAGFALEAPAFTLSGRGLRSLVARPETSQEPSLAAELASSYLSLGALKMTGLLSSGLARHLRLGEGSFGTSALQLGSGLSGLLLARRLENTAGLRPDQGGAIALVDSLATLLQFRVGGRLAGQLFGPRFAAWERGLDLQTQILSHPDRAAGLHLPLLERPALAGGPETRLGPWAVFMSAKDPERPSRPLWTPNPSTPRPELPIRTTGLYMIIHHLPQALRRNRPLIQYEGDAWQEGRDAGAIAGRLRGAIPLSREKTFELILLNQRQHLTFFWEGDSVIYKARTFSDLSELEFQAAPASPQNTADTVPQMAAVREAPAKPTAGRYHLQFNSESAAQAAASATSASSTATPRIWVDYENLSNRRVDDLAKWVLPQTSSNFPEREEGGALRGRVLARVANFAMLRSQGEDTPVGYSPEEVVTEIARVLELAYRHLDFGTIDAFRERTTQKALSNFERVLAWRHRDAIRAGETPPLRLQDMPTNFEGNYLIPQSEPLRSAFLQRMGESRNEAEIPSYVSRLLQSPQEIARLHAAILHPRMQRLFSNALLLETLVPGERSWNLLDPQREFRHAEAAALHADSAGILRETPEISRLLLNGRGDFHRQYVKALFFTAPQGLRDVYAPYYDLLSKLPHEWTGLVPDRAALPTLGQVRDFTRHSSQPPRSR